MTPGRLKPSGKLFRIDPADCEVLMHSLIHSQQLSPLLSNWQKFP